MEQSKIFECLVNIDKRLQKIERDLNKDKSAIGNAESETELKVASENNFYNQLKEDLDDHASIDSKFEKSRSKTEIKKSSSFTERSVTKPSKIKRSSHTVPSDKAEEKRLEGFRRECLSKAIQWNFVDIINAADTDYKIDPPIWMSYDDKMTILEDTGKKMHLRRFLNLLRERSFEDMKNWINNCDLKSEVLKQVWDTFEEFSDHDVNNLSMKCLHHRIVENVDITLVGDYFHTADIIEKEHNMRIMETKLPVGAQQVLWMSLLKECSKVTNGKVVLGALKIALSDYLSMTGNDIDEELFQALHEEVNKSLDVQDILQCRCDEICARSLHPLSCLKTMSLSKVYFSPPTHRKREDQSSQSDNGPKSTSSSSSTDDSSIDSQVSKIGSVATNIDEDGLANKRKMESAFEKRRSSKASTRVRKEKKKADDLIGSGGDTGSIGKTAITNHCETTESHYLENKPTIITTKNVYIGSGPKYLTKIKNACSHSRTTSVKSTPGSPASSISSSSSRSSGESL